MRQSGYTNRLWPRSEESDECTRLPFVQSFQTCKNCDCQAVEAKQEDEGNHVSIRSFSLANSLFSNSLNPKQPLNWDAKYLYRLYDLHPVLRFCCYMCYMLNLSLVFGSFDIVAMVLGKILWASQTEIAGTLFSSVGFSFWNETNRQQRLSAAETFVMPLAIGSSSRRCLTFRGHKGSRDGNVPKT